MKAERIPLAERIVTDLPEGTKDALDIIAYKYRLTRTDIVREAIVDLLTKYEVGMPMDLIDLAPCLSEYAKTFGMPMDGYPAAAFMGAGQ